MAFPEPTATWGCVSATINSRVYVWGGGTESEDTSHLVNLYILDIRTEKWLFRPIAGQHPPGFGFCATAQDDNLLYVYGGVNDGGKETGSLYCLDLNLPSWKELSHHNSRDGPQEKRGCGMVVHEDKIFLFGGNSDISSADKYTNELHVFNLTTGMYVC